MVTLQPYIPEYYDDLTAYCLDEEQTQFSMVPQQILNNPEVLAKVERTQYCILYHAKPVGFFSLDTSTDRLVYTSNQHAILLRALSLNPQYQGKGIAKQAMLLLPDFVKTHYPAINEIVFGVNFENEQAYQLYLKTHYRDTQKVYQGVKGPQRVMAQKIK